MRPAGYLCLNGYELINDTRTQAYLTAGLVPGWTSDDEFTCDALDESGDLPAGRYTSPQVDDAPWYLAARPESADYVGMLLTDMELPAPMARAFNAAGPVGGSFARLSLRHRIVGVQAIMYASSECGMEWGERWLNDVLVGNICDQVSDLGSAVILPCCPTEDEDRFFRTLERVGLVDAPQFSQVGSDQSVPSCHAQRVSFQLAAEMPWLYAPATTLADEAVGAGDVTGGVATTADWVGDAGIRITIDPSTDWSGRITATPLLESEVGDCPGGSENAALDYAVALPAGHTLTFDSSTRQILELDPTRKRYVSGLGRLTYPGPFDWIEVPACSLVCVSVTGIAGSAQVTIEQIDREL